MQNNLKALRINAGLKQRELADKLGTSPSQITKWEKGQARLTDLWIARLAKALNVAPSAFFSDEIPGKSLSTADIVALNRQLRRRIAQSGKVLTEDQEDLLLTVMLDFAAEHPMATAAELKAALATSLEITTLTPEKRGKPS